MKSVRRLLRLNLKTLTRSVLQTTQLADGGRRLVSSGMAASFAGVFPPKSSSSSSRPTLRGIVFDMDGTLTVPNLDFDEMYRRCGLRRDGTTDILSAIRDESIMDPTRASRARAMIEEMEEEGRRTLRLSPGAIELGTWLSGHGVPVSLVTRNTRRTVDVLLNELWRPLSGCVAVAGVEDDCDGLLGIATFEHTLARDDHVDGRSGSPSPLPPKPHPASLQEIARRWSIDLPTPDLLMVGDSPTNDVAFGRAAGVSTALVDTARRWVAGEKEECRNMEGRTGGADADLCVSALHELPLLLWENFAIRGPLGTDVPRLEKVEAPMPRSRAARAAAVGNVDSLTSLPLEELRAAPDQDGNNTPLIWASDVGHVDAVEVLLRRLGGGEEATADAVTPGPSYDVNRRGYLGATALSRASRRGHTDVVRLLLDVGGADANVPNDKMQYPLHFAAFNWHAGVVRALLEGGASTLVLDRKGRTPAEDTDDGSIRDMILRWRRDVS